ncbi:NACHT, LRR and PYD domains-containing protein 12-like [Notamacropus eugenii]|uniref:NACHT, LRR and PYD domains-containing protein 12-like n=1 Tax=Notamacropus eugenii TaxID=9315 RepID=UPI003B6799CB
MAEDVLCRHPGSELGAPDAGGAEEIQPLPEEPPLDRTSPGGRMDWAGITETVEFLVSFLGNEEPWKLALSIWEKMGLTELWERAREEGLQGLCFGVF